MEAKLSMCMFLVFFIVVDVNISTSHMQQQHYPHSNKMINVSRLQGTYEVLGVGGGGGCLKLFNF